MYVCVYMWGNPSFIIWHYSPGLPTLHLSLLWCFYHPHTHTPTQDKGWHAHTPCQTTGSQGQQWSGMHVNLVPIPTPNASTTGAQERLAGQKTCFYLMSEATAVSVQSAGAHRFHWIDSRWIITYYLHLPKLNNTPIQVRFPGPPRPAKETPQTQVVRYIMFQVCNCFIWL